MSEGENAACARRLEAMGELYARRAPEDDDERTGWLVDGYETVCPDDPRTKDQRRADALGALAAGLGELRCECESEDCAATARPTGSSVVIYVLAEQSTVQGTGTTPGYVPGHGPLPASVVQELAREAKLKPLTVPDPTAPPEPEYRPSAALAAFVRARDLTCRFPGCDAPAEVCDIDQLRSRRRWGRRIRRT